MADENENNAQMMQNMQQMLNEMKNEMMLEMRKSSENMISLVHRQIDQVIAKVNQTEQNFESESVKWYESPDQPD